MLKALSLHLTNLTARAIPLAVAAALAGIATAQNLVPNPSFEDTVDCNLNTQCTLLKAAHWYNPNTATPDIQDGNLADPCGPSNDTTTASAIGQGYQWARTGLRLAGAIQWFGPGSSFTKEYLMSKLTSPLAPNASYEVAVYCSKQDNYQFAVDGFGAYLGVDSVFENHPNHLTTVIPQLHLVETGTPYLLDGQSWTRVADTLVAVGGEEWLVIGSYLPPDLVNGIEAIPGSQYSQAYYFFDDVSVRLLEGTSAVGELQAWATSGGGSWCIRWTGSDPLTRIRIWDSSGRLLVEMDETLRRGEVIDLANGSLAPGIYLLEGISAQRRATARIVKEGGAH